MTSPTSRFAPLFPWRAAASVIAAALALTACSGASEAQRQAAASVVPPTDCTA
jgi:hypothetical protein